MRRRARLGRYFTFARQSPVTFLSGTKDVFSNGDRHDLPCKVGEIARRDWTAIQRA